MKMLARAAFALTALMACAPSFAQKHALDSQSYGPAPEQACVTWSGGTIGAGSLVPCGASGGGTGGGGPVTAASGSFVDGFNPNLGTISDTAYTGTGNASLTAIGKGMYSNLTALTAANGTPADTAYAGTGNTTEVGALKGIYAATLAPLPAGTNVIGTVRLSLDATAFTGAAGTTVLGNAANQFKATSGNIASLNIVNSTVAGYAAVLDVAAAPTAGAAITAAQLKYCFPIAAGPSPAGGLDKAWPVPLNTSTGILVAVLTSCTTFTTVGTAPISISVQFK